MKEKIFYLWRDFFIVAVGFFYTSTDICLYSDLPRLSISFNTKMNHTLAEEPKKIELTQGKFALVDASDYEWLNQWKWYALKMSDTFYAYRASAVVKCKRRSSIAMHRVVMNTPKGMETDHINRDGLDNRRENLRVATNRQNQWNRGIGKNNTSGYKGVSWDRYNKKWVASIRHENKRKALGYFKTPEEAAVCYNDWANKLYGEFARPNTI